MEKILIVVGDDTSRAALTKLLSNAYYQVLSTPVPGDLPALVRQHDPLLLILDADIVKTQGELVKASFPQKIMLAWMAERNAAAAVALIEAGAFDCVCPPIDAEEVTGVVRHAVEKATSAGDTDTGPGGRVTLLYWLLGSFVVVAAVAVIFLAARR